MRILELFAVLAFVIAAGADEYSQYTVTGLPHFLGMRSTVSTSKKSSRSLKCCLCAFMYPI